ncbi:MAG: hypothetical protein II404_09575 [Prevotella sp.]|nr:hypothetical protein [Prevotella sp.]
MILLSKKSQEEIHPQDQTIVSEPIIGKCFFSYSYVLDQDDDKKRKERKRREYSEDKENPQCGYAHIIDHEMHKEYIWDGREERQLDIGPLDETEKRFIKALIYLNSVQAERRGNGIIQQYDYAWVYRAIEKNLFMGSKKLKFKSVTEFVKYVHKIVQDYKLKVDIGNSDNINFYLKNTFGDNLAWRWRTLSLNETNRRNNIANAFVSMMNPLYN